MMFQLHRKWKICLDNDYLDKHHLSSEAMKKARDVPF